MNVDWRRGRCASNECVEAGPGEDGMVYVRDSKAPAGPWLQFTPAEWDAFTAAVRAGEFA